MAARSQWGLETAFIKADLQSICTMDFFFFWWWARERRDREKKEPQQERKIRPSQREHGPNLEKWNCLWDQSINDFRPVRGVADRFSVEVLFCNECLSRLLCHQRAHAAVLGICLPTANQHKMFILLVDIFSVILWESGGQGVWLLRTLNIQHSK